VFPEIASARSNVSSADAAFHFNRLATLKFAARNLIPTRSI